MMKNKRGQVQPAAVAAEPAVANNPVVASPIENQNLSQEQPKKGSRKWLWIVIALVAIGAIGILVWFIFAGGEGSVVGSGLGSSVPTPPKFPS